MGTLAKRITKLMYILVLFTCFVIAIAAVALIGAQGSLTESSTIVGNIVGYSTIAILLMRFIMLRRPIPCRLEFALAAIASVLWFATATLALSLRSTYCGDNDFYINCNWYYYMAAIMCFVNGALLCTFFVVLCILISRQLKHGNKDVWANPLTTAILTVSAPPDLEISDRPDARVDGHDPQMIQAMPLVTTPSHMLLNPNCNMGQDMPIAEFCEAFGLQPSVLEKLKENAFDHARYLRYITMDNLTEMGFKLGEKAALQEAVERWFVSRV